MEELCQTLMQMSQSLPAPGTALKEGLPLNEVLVCMEITRALYIY